MEHQVREEGLYVARVSESLLGSLTRAIQAIPPEQENPWRDRDHLERTTFEYGVSFQAIERDGVIVRTRVPRWLARARKELVTLFRAQLAEHKTRRYDNCIITRYGPGDGIRKHKDRDYFGPDVLGIIITPDTSPQAESPPSVLSFSKPDTVGEPPSTEIGVLNMPPLKAKKLRKLPQEKVLLEL